MVGAAQGGPSGAWRVGDLPSSLAFLLKSIYAYHVLIG